MSASIPRFVANEPKEHIVAGLREHGAVRVEGVLAPACHPFYCDICDAILGPTP